ncbi:MAG: TonB-dependent receptor [Halioglobus sp.]
MKFNKTVLASAIGLLSTAVVSGAQAQLEEVVVTAQKRAQSMQDIPISVSSYTGDDLRGMGVVDTGSIISSTPGLTGNKDSDSQTIYTIRGVGTGAFSPGADNSVGTYFNEVPVSRNIGGQGFLDIERVEVVKGPQGTLFGRNTSSGAISVTNNAAEFDDNFAEVFLGAGDEGQKSAELTANYAVSDDFALRFAGKHDERDGIYQDVNGKELGGRDHDQWRISMQWDATDTLNVKWFVENFEFENRWQPDLYFPNDGLDGFNEVIDADHSDIPKQSADNQLSVLNIGWDLSDMFTLTSTTGYFDSDVMALPLDLTFGDPEFSLNFYEPWSIEQVTQDFRLNGSTDNLDFFVGVSYYNEEVEATTVLPAWFEGEALPVESNNSKNETTSYALFGDVTWRATDRLSLTLGGRWTTDEKEMAITAVNTDILGVFLPTNGTQKDDTDWSSFDPRIAIDYALNDDTLLYANYASGFKSGGFSRQPVDPAGGVFIPGQFDEETNDAYELGVKWEFWDNRARLNTALFFMDYKDFQLETNDGLSIQIQNAADMESKGIEIDGTFLLTENLDIRVAYAYLDAEYKSGALMDGDGNPVPLKGQTPARSPENTFNIAGTWTLPLSFADLTTRLQYSYTDERRFIHAPDPEGTFTQDGYDLVDLRVTLASHEDTWSVALVGENLGDEEYISSMIDFGAPLAVRGVGRLMRMEVSYRF